MPQHDVSRLDAACVAVEGLTLVTKNMKGRARPPLQIEDLRCYHGERWGLLASDPSIFSVLAPGLLGLYPPESGVVRLAAKPWGRAIVFTIAPTLQGLSALENLRYLSLLSPEPAISDAVLDAVIHRTSAWIGKRPRSLSREERRQYSYAASLLQAPQVFTVAPPEPLISTAADAEYFRLMVRDMPIGSGAGDVAFLCGVDLSILLYGVSHLACFDDRGLAWSGPVTDVDHIIGPILVERTNGRRVEELPSTIAQQHWDQEPDGFGLIRSDTSHVVTELCKGARST